MLRAEDQNMHFTNKAMFFSASESIVADPRHFKVCLSAKTLFRVKVCVGDI